MLKHNDMVVNICIVLECFLSDHTGYFNINVLATSWFVQNILIIIIQFFLLMLFRFFVVFNYIYYEMLLLHENL